MSEQTPRRPKSTLETERATASDAAGLVSLGQEQQPQRMVAVTPQPADSLSSAPARASAVSAYVAPVTFDWRNKPLARVNSARS